MAGLRFLLCWLFPRSGMEFVNPWLLAGAGAAIVPVVLHLIMRQKPKHLEFPALRFIARRQMNNTRRLRLRHWLLLALRMLLFGVVSAALARPTIQATGFLAEREAPVSATLVFDTSPRMDYRHANQTRIEVARDMARWLLGQLPADSQLAVLDSRLDSAVYQIDEGGALARIDRLETTTSPRSMTEVLAAAGRLLEEGQHPQREMYVFTDLSQEAWASTEAAQLRARLAELKSFGLYIIDVGVEQPQNFALADLSPSGQVLARNTPLLLQTSAHRLGPTGTRVVELLVNDPLGRPHVRHEETVELTADETAPLTFSLAGLAEGTHQGQVRFRGEDGLAADDVRYFTVEVKAPWKVLLLAPTMDAAFFLSEALAPEHFRKNDQARFLCETVTLDALEKTDLAPFAAVCLVDPGPLNNAGWQKLAEYVRAGGGVAVFLGRNAQAESFNQPLPQEILPGHLAQQSRHPDGDNILAPASFSHPIVAPFARRAGSNPWIDFPIFRYWRLEGVPAEAAIVIPYSDGQPALIDRPVGRGRVITLTTPVSDPLDEMAWNLLPTGFEPWPFVILANETLHYLVGNSDSSLNYVAGQTATLRLPPGHAFTGCLVTDPQGTATRQTIAAGQETIVESNTERLGNYRVQSGGDAGFDRGFSVNLSPAASELARLEEGGLEAFFGELKYQHVRTQDDLLRQRQFARVGQELFPYLMLCLALFMGLEQVISNRFYREH